MQRLIAAFLMAALTCIFYRAARLLLPAGWSTVIALGAAFGTPVWSSLSRGLWGQTWAVLLAGYLMYRLLEDNVDGRPLNGVSLATVTSWMFFTRPTGAIVAVAVSIYLACDRKRVMLPWILTGLFWLACFVGFSMKVYGQPLPQYYLGGFLHRGHMLKGIATILFSPSRGWFVFVPMSLWVLYLLLRNYAALRHRALALVALGIGLAEVPLIACDIKWWGGYSYGPRLMADLIPWFVLLAVLGCAAELHRGPGANITADASIPGMPRTIQRIGAAALAISILMNAPGALSTATMWWNIRPADLDKHPKRVWDWKRPQFLAWALPATAREESKDGAKR